MALRLAALILISVMVSSNSYICLIRDKNMIRYAGPVVNMERIKNAGGGGSKA